MNPQSLFTNYIIAGGEALLARVHAAASVIPDADRQQAWHLLSFALKLDETWPVARALLLALAPKMEQAGFREEWIPYLEQGIHCAVRNGDERTIAQCELQIGLLYRLLSRFEEAEQCLTSSSVRFATQGNTTGQAHALLELAWLVHLQHRYEMAERYVEQAIKLPTTDRHVEANAWRMKGMIAIGRRQWREAVEAHRKALFHFQQLGDQRKVAWSMQNLGYALKELDMLDDAQNCLCQAAETLHQLQDHYHLAVVRMNLANVLVKQEKTKAAYDLFINAQEVFARHGDSLSQAHVLTNLGIVLLELHESSAAQNQFRSAAQLYATLGDHVWYINALDGLVMALTAGGQYAEALTVADEALARLPSIQDSAYHDNLLGKLTGHRAEAKLKGEALPHNNCGKASS